MMNHGYDARDALIQNLNVGDGAEDVLARRYCSPKFELAMVER